MYSFTESKPDEQHPRMSDFKIPEQFFIKYVFQNLTFSYFECVTPFYLFHFYGNVHHSDKKHFMFSVRVSNKSYFIYYGENPVFERIYDEILQIKFDENLGIQALTPALQSQLVIFTKSLFIIGL